MLTELFRQTLLLSLLGSIVAGGILAIKAAFGRRLSPRLHYYLWVVVLLRLAIPLTVDTPLGLVRLPWPERTVASQTLTYAPPATTHTAASPQSADEGKIALPTKQVISPVPATADLGATALRYGAWVWLGGTAALLAHMAVVNLLYRRRFRLKYLRANPDISRLFDRCKRQLGITADIPLLLCPPARTPMLFGLFRPKVLLSADLADTLPPQQLRYMLLHELTHWKRRDLLLHALANLLRAIYWFNPLVWYAVGRMKQDCEIACDDAVLQGATAQDRRQYGSALLDMMAMQSSTRRIPGTVGFIRNYHRRRMQMIVLNAKTSRLCTGAAALAVLALLAGCAGTSYPAMAGTQTTPNPTQTAAQPSATATPTPTEPRPTGTADSSEAQTGPGETPTPTDTPTPTGTADSGESEASPAETPTPTDPPPPAPTPRPTGENRYDVSGIQDPAAFEAWYHQLQGLVKAGDKNAVATQVRYPIRVKLNQKATTIKDKAAFVKNYEAIFTDKVTAALMNTEVQDAFVNYQGVMVGQGELWFTAVADSKPQAFVIYGINN